MRQALSEAFEALGRDASVRCVVLTGGEAVFAAGADLKALAALGPIELLLLEQHRLWQTIATCPKPLVAAVNGWALGGGCELAMHADLIVAGEGARFGQPEVKVGILPGAGGTQRLVRAVGKFKALKLLLTGDPITGREAYEMGLASELVPDAEVQPRALALAEQIASRPPLAVAQIKEVVLAGQDAPLDTALALERKAFQLLFASQDQKEGMRAFLEKRPADFQGR
jgi:enoyl-CoA hydratase/carnithine racemase